MTSPDFATVAPKVSSTPRDQLDTLVTKLASKKQEWTRVSTAKRADYLERCIVKTRSVAADWVKAACEAKGIDLGSSRAGEEWLAGPMTTIRNLRLFAEAMRCNGEPPIPRQWTRPDGQVVAEVFPQNTLDKLMYTGISAEVWLEPGHKATQGKIYRDKRNVAREGGGVGPYRSDANAPVSAAPIETLGKLALVLGAGNVASIGPMDALYKLIVDDEVVLVKTNPVNAYLQPFWEEAFRPLLDDGYYAVVRGGADVGEYLCNHPQVDTIHITGSDRTHDAIVWGAGPGQDERKKLGQRKLEKPITSELGAVTPVIVVPGEWSESDLQFQARHVAGMVVNNGSFNCNAAKIVVTSAGWPQRARFLELVHAALSRTPVRKAYYPGAQERYQGFLDHYPNAMPLGERTKDVVPWTILPDVPAHQGEYALTTEAFCGVLAETQLEATDPSAFLEAATRFANEDCWGSLSCVMLIHPETARQHARAFDAAVAGLRYGGIAINAFAGVVYALVTPTWGAFPGHPLEDIRSGRGVVHNALLLDHPQKSVVRAPFRMSPTPAWFPDHKTGHQLGPLITDFEAAPSFLKLPFLLPVALRG